MKVVVDTETWSGLINYKTRRRRSHGHDRRGRRCEHDLHTKADWGVYVPTTTAQALWRASQKPSRRATRLFFRRLCRSHRCGTAPIGWSRSIPCLTTVRSTAWWRQHHPGAGSWTTSGTPGDANYKTNGQLVAWIVRIPLRLLRRGHRRHKHLSESGRQLPGGRNGRCGQHGRCLHQQDSDSTDGCHGHHGAPFPLAI